LPVKALQRTALANSVHLSGQEFVRNQASRLRP
jgi:hypothetical protein